jgi:RNA polymerase sigma-70 factor (ECF subfamily)
MTDIDSLVTDLDAGRKRFLDLVADIRPDLHRYCARMTGSVVDGEDIVQETLARAYYALPEMQTVPPLRSWLFQIAHSRAIDHLRRYDRRKGSSLDELTDVAGSAEVPEDAMAREEAVRAALSVFLELPPFPRSCVILKDVIGHSVDEIALLLEQSTAAVKAALHRGRARLRELRASVASASSVSQVRSTSATVARYVALFNARDWDGVRTLLADEVRLDLVSRSQRSGRRDVSGYVANYARFDDWFLVPARLDGAEVVAGFRNEHEDRPSYFIELEIAGGRVTRIRDFRYVPYICVDAPIEFTERPTAASFRRRAS